MGLEYIRSKAGKAHIKRWAQGIDRLKRPSLLDINLSEDARTVTAILTAGCSPKPGDAFLVQCGGTGELVVLDGHRQIARVPNPPAALTEAINACHGIAPAIVERIENLGDTAELKLK